MQAIDEGAQRKRLVQKRAQVAAGALFAGGQRQHGVLNAGLDQIILERRLVLHVLEALAARDFIQRRLGDVEIAALDHLRHLAEEEGEQQRADMGAVHVSIGHDDDLVVAHLFDVELVLADARAQSHDQRADLLGAEHAVKAGALDIEDFAAQRQDRLVLPRAAALGRAAGAVTLDDEDFGLGRIALLTVG